jgi:hypothetical protein
VGEGERRGARRRHLGGGASHRPVGPRVRGRRRSSTRRQPKGPLATGHLDPARGCNDCSTRSASASPPTASCETPSTTSATLGSRSQHGAAFEMGGSSSPSPLANPTVSRLRPQPVLSDASKIPGRVVRLRTVRPLPLAHRKRLRRRYRSHARKGRRTEAPLRPDAWHPVHGHDVAVCELAIGGSSSTVAVATRHQAAAAPMR